MSTTYRIHLYVEVTDAAQQDSYEWEAVAQRVANRLRRSRQPLDREGRLRIQHVSIDTAEEP
jgi:hypothetical protein